MSVGSLKDIFVFWGFAPQRLTYSLISIVIIAQKPRFVNSFNTFCSEFLFFFLGNRCFKLISSMLLKRYVVWVKITLPADEFLHQQTAFLL